MRKSREQGKAGIHIRQSEAKKKEETERKQVADDIQKMYEATKTSVQTKLKALDIEVNALFDGGELLARTKFESHVATRMYNYKYNRYIKRFGGTALWIKDQFMDLPSEVNVFYEEGRDIYIKDMDKVIVNIANTVETRLKEVKAEIKKGKDKIADYVADLPKKLKKAGDEAQKNMQSNFDELEQSVEAKKQDLANSMARRYKESRNKLEQRIKKLKEANKGLVNKCIDKVKGVIETLKKFKNKIGGLLKSSRHVIAQIVKDPGKFLDNLSDAVKKGFSSFRANFPKHLKNGFVSWILGSMSKTGLIMPQKFNFAGIFGLVVQVVGITKDWVRTVIVKYVGAKNVARVEKAWALVSVLFKDGFSGLWAKAKKFLTDLKSKLFDNIRNWLITQVVKQAVLWVLSLLNPASALLKIIKLIYDIVMFFVENIDRIITLVQTVLKSTAMIMAGKIGAAAKWIEKTMAQTIPIIIGFLARLLGISGISDKIRQFMKMVQMRVRTAVENVIKKIVSSIKGVLSGGKKAASRTVKGAVSKIKAFIFPKKVFSIGKKKHTLYFKALQ